MKPPGVPADPEWERLSALIDQALDLPLAQREGWLHALAGADAELRPRLQALLARVAQAERLGFLAEPAAVTMAGEGARSASHAVSAQVGPWRLLELLGVGGMGEVWRARRSDDMVERDVALKLPLPDLLSGGLIERFARERTILASLEHRWIARLYDAGIADTGSPWLAMEYVDGVPITVHCESHALGVAPRLLLVQQACDALQHAHNRLVIHRDIKPGNMLVTPAGELRLLDFGIAQMLSPDPLAPRSELTHATVAAMTPGHAAPEQVRGEPASTATDVYSLGVVLYRLLCGSSPHQPVNQTTAALERAVLDADPAPPSQRVAAGGLQRQLRGDLDAIALKALERDPKRRYQTAAALHDEIARHLAGLPVLARPQSRAYRASRFIARHGWALTGGALTVLALVSGTAVALLQAREARIEAARSNAMYRFVLDLFNPDGKAAVDPSIKDRKVSEVIADAATRAGQALGDVPQAREQLLVNLTELTHGLGMPDEAERLRQQRLQLARAAHGDDSDAVLAIQAERVRPLQNAGQTEQALALAEASLAVCEMRRCADITLAALLAAAGEVGKLVHPAPWSVERERLERAMALYSKTGRPADALADGLDSLIAIYINTGQEARAEALSVQALETARALYGENGWVTGRWKEDLGDILRARGRPAAAAQMQREAIATMDAQWGARSLMASRTRLQLVTTLTPSIYRDEAVRAALAASEALRLPQNAGETHLRAWAQEASTTLDARRGRALPVILSCRRALANLNGNPSALQMLRSCAEIANAVRAPTAAEWTNQLSALVRDEYGDVPSARWVRLIAEAESAESRGNLVQARERLDAAWPIRPPGRLDLAARWSYASAINVCAATESQADAVSLVRLHDALGQVGAALDALPVGDDAPFYGEARALLLEARARLLTRTGQPADAATDLRQALALRETLDDTRQSIWMERTLKALLQAQRQLGDATASAQTSQRLQQLAGEQGGLAIARMR